MLYPTLSVTGPDGEFVLATVDDYFPAAAEQTGNSLTIYFRDARARDLQPHRHEPLLRAADVRSPHAGARRRGTLSGSGASGGDGTHTSVRVSGSAPSSSDAEL